MRLISFFSKFTFICNICFLLFLFFSKLDAGKTVAAANDRVVAFPFFKDLVIILGFSAIIINSLMCLVYLVVLMSPRRAFLPKWLASVNGIFLFVEFYFFFL